MDFQQEMKTARDLVEKRLGELFPGGGLAESMRYSLLAGGKRIRPILTMKFCEAAGGSMEEALDFGCGVEMLHTYSLIHDDLPCMDNAELRRGLETNHRRFGECTAVLAGDALQAEAFRAVLSATGTYRHGGEFKAKSLAARYLAESAGAEGMCLGQYWDTLGCEGLRSPQGESLRPPTLEELTAINDKKTGALLRAACMMGVAASLGRRDVEEDCFASARDYATNLGLAFQIKDDALDMSSTAEEMGKTVRADASNGKTTYAALLGPDGCQEMVLAYTNKAKAALSACSWAGDVSFLCRLADSLAIRSN